MTDLSSDMFTPKPDEPSGGNKETRHAPKQGASLSIAATAADGAGVPDSNGNSAKPGLMIRDNNHPGTSLAEKALHYFHRLTWRTPLHRVRLKGRSPLRLLAKPEDPLTGNKTRGMAIRAGHFLHNGMKQPLSGIDFADLKLPPLFVEYIHGFRWLRDLAAAAPREDGAPIAEKLMERWLDAHAEKVSDPAWRPEYAGARILFWAAHSPLILSSRDLIYRSRVLRNMARTARHLDHSADKADEGLPRLIAWCGVVAASLVIPDGKPRQIFGEAGLKRALSKLFEADGGVVSRSPMVQIEAITVLTMLQSVYNAVKTPVYGPLQEALAKAVPALQGITHQDGSLGSWQGAPGLAADQVAQIIEASGVRTRPLRDARNWGYQRIAAGKSVTLVDAGIPPLARHSATGCASTLAFEMSHGSHRIIVNCGGAAMAGALVPAGLCTGLRATAAHSTLCLDDHNSTAILDQGKLGRGVNEVAFDRREVENATRLEMSHDGYSEHYGLVHRRTMLIRSDGNEIRGEDILLPGAVKARGGKSGSPQEVGDMDYAIRFHLGLGVEAHVTSDGHGALMRIADGSLWQLRAPAHMLEIDDSIWIDGRGRPHPTQQVIMAGTVAQDGGSYAWAIKKMG